MSQDLQHHILKKYSIIKKLGSGAYGHVWKVSDRTTGQILALKKIFDAFQHSTDAQRTYRQIVILHQINHHNVIKLHNVIKAYNDQDLYLVFEYMQADLHNAIGQKILQDIHNRYIIYQLTKAIKYLHSVEIIHRDLKPSNLLLNSDCLLKVCDFGLARSLLSNYSGQDTILTQQVATRWYRAPQVLLGSHVYGKPADIWSLGCIFGELLLGKPLFPGSSTLNQLERIISFTGRPKIDDIHSLNSQVAQTMISSLPLMRYKKIIDWFPSQTPLQAINLLQKLLQFNPLKRLSIDNILKHPYLLSFRNQNDQIQSKQPIYLPIDDNKKLTMKQYRQLIYDRIDQIYHEKTNPQKYSNSKDSKNKQYFKDRNLQNSKSQQKISLKRQQRGQSRHSFDKNKNQDNSSINNNSNNKIWSRNSIKDILKNRKTPSKNDKYINIITYSNKYIKNISYSFAKENKQIVKI